MFFRLWYYYCKIGVPALIGWMGFMVILGVTRLNVPMPELFGASFLVAGSILFGSAVIGAVMGVLMVFDLLMMKCPFCGNRGRVGGNRQYGLLLECSTCGVVRSRGKWSLDLICDQRDDEFDGSP